MMVLATKSQIKQFELIATHFYRMRFFSFDREGLIRKITRALLFLL